MICAIRPGHSYYDETINTLRYADRAKKIKNKPTINESPQDKLIRDLQEENERLKAAMGNGGVIVAPGADMTDLQKQKEELEARLKHFEQLELDWAEKIKIAEGEKQSDQ